MANKYLSIAVGWFAIALIASIIISSRFVVEEAGGMTERIYKSIKIFLNLN